MIGNENLPTEIHSAHCMCIYMLKMEGEFTNPLIMGNSVWDFSFMGHGPVQGSSNSAIDKILNLPLIHL